jgi:hypothetical protein
MVINRQFYAEGEDEKCMRKKYRSGSLCRNETGSGRYDFIPVNEKG